MSWRATFQSESGQWMRRCCKCAEAKPLKKHFYKYTGNYTLCHSFTYVCKACEKVRRKNETPETKRLHAERIKRGAEANPQREKERHQRYREKLKADPKRHTEHLESRRISEHLRREKAGVLRSKFQPGKMGKYEEHRLPARPLYLAAKKYVEGIVADGGTVQEACKNLETTDREYRRWVNQEQTEVQYRTADRILTNLGLHWWDVWDESEVPERIAA